MYVQFEKCLRQINKAHCFKCWKKHQRIVVSLWQWWLLHLKTTRDKFCFFFSFIHKWKCHLLFKCCCCYILFNSQSNFYFICTNTTYNEKKVMHLGNKLLMMWCRADLLSNCNTNFIDHIWIMRCLMTKRIHQTLSCSFLPCLLFSFNFEVALQTISSIILLSTVIGITRSYILCFTISYLFSTHSTVIILNVLTFTRFKFIYIFTSINHI